MGSVIPIKMTGIEKPVSGFRIRWRILLYATATFLYEKIASHLYRQKTRLGKLFQKSFCLELAFLKNLSV